MTPIKIYGLYSNENIDNIKYIGKTKFALKKRLNEHIKGALCYNKQTYKDNWIRKVYGNGYKVEIKLIEYTDLEHWQERESFWIKEYKGLTNLTNGGEGGHGFNNIYDYDLAKKHIKDNYPFIKSSQQYINFTKSENFPKDKLPVSAEECYKLRGSWKGWGDFLSTNRKADIEKTKLYFKFEIAKRKLKKFKLKNSSEYKFLIKDLPYFPQKPNRFYKSKGWNGWNDYLGNKPPSLDVLKRYLKMFFPEVNTFYRFKIYHSKMNFKIPLDLYKTYNVKNFKEIFGYDKFMTYKDAVLYIKDFHFKTLNEYKKYINDNNIYFLSKSPHKYYGDEFKSLSLYFSNRVSDKKNVTFELFSRYMRIYHKEIKNSTHYKNMFNIKNISNRIPKRPDVKYQCHWKELFNKIHVTQ